MVVITTHVDRAIVVTTNRLVRAAPITRLLVHLDLRREQLISIECLETLEASYR